MFSGALNTGAEHLFEGAVFVAVWSHSPRGPESVSRCAGVFVVRGAAQLADMHNRDTGPGRHEFGQMWQIGRDDHYGRHLISGFRLLCFRYRGRGLPPWGNWAKVTGKPTLRRNAGQG